MIAEPDLAAMLAEFDERRLDAAGKYAWKPAATGQLAVSEEECRDVLWATLDRALWPAAYLTASLKATPQRYVVVALIQPPF